MDTRLLSVGRAAVLPAHRLASGDVVQKWIRFYNHRRPHQALGMKTPAMAYALAA